MQRHSWHFKYGNWSSEVLIFCHLSGMMFVLDSLQVRVYLSSKVQPFPPHFPSNKTINNVIISTLDDNSHLSHFLWNKKKKPVHGGFRSRSLWLSFLSRLCLYLSTACGRFGWPCIFMLSGISGCSSSVEVYFLTIQEKGKKLACYRRWAMITALYSEPQRDWGGNCELTSIPFQWLFSLSCMVSIYFNQPVLDGRHNIQTGRDQKTHLLATVPSVLIWQKTPHDPQGAAAEKCHVISLESPVCLPVSPSVRPFSVLTDLTSTVNIKIHISSKKHYMVIHLFCVCVNVCACMHV